MNIPMIRQLGRRRLTTGRACVAALGLSLAVVLSACGGNGGAASGGTASGKQSTTLVVASPQEPTDWDFVRNPSTAIRQVLVHNVLEPLIEKKQDGSFAPLLAEKYDVSKDGLVYTFTLRKATFHNGKAMTADDVVASLNYGKSSPQGDVSAPYKTVRSIEKVDERTVKVTLKQPSQRFLEGMSTDSALIFPKGAEKGLAKKPIGTGPFMFDTWRNGVEVTLKRNESYWSAKPHFEDVTWKFIGDETSSINRLLAHEVDLVNPIIGDGMARVGTVEKTKGFAADHVAGAEISYISLNAGDPALKDKRVREAIAHAIDRQPIIDGGLSGLAKPTCVFVNPPTEAWKSDYCPYGYDPAKAKALLAEAGVTNLKLRYVYLKSNYFPASMEIISKQLKDVGIEVQTTPVDLATYVDRVVTKFDYQITHITGPQTIDSWMCPGWFTRDCDKQFDDTLVKADAMLDRNQWAETRRKAVEMYADRAHLIPLMNVDLITLRRADLAGFKQFTSSSEVDLRPLHWAAN